MTRMSEKMSFDLMDLKAATLEASRTELEVLLQTFENPTLRDDARTVEAYHRGAQVLRAELRRRAEGEKLAKVLGVRSTPEDEKAPPARAGLHLEA
jgi:hypothetical protein